MDYLDYVPVEYRPFINNSFKFYMDNKCPGYASVLSEEEIQRLKEGYERVQLWVNTLANTYKAQIHHNKSGLDYANTISKNKDELERAISNFLIDFRQAVYAVRQAAGKDQESDLSEDSGSSFRM